MIFHNAYKKLAPLLRPLSLPYALLMAKRRAWYTRGIFSSFTPSCPCVAIGNIAWGGTGKTPLTAWLLAWSRQQGIKAVVLTRGYGGSPGNKPLLVRADTAPEQSGDEALMLAQAFPEFPVLAFPQRNQSAIYAQNTLNPELFILDDGMQHLRMGRHADIILLRPEDLKDAWNRVIPAGSWREGASALASATVFAIKTDAEYFDRLAPLAKKKLSVFGKGLFSFTLTPGGLRPLNRKTGQQHDSLLTTKCPPYKEIMPASEDMPDPRTYETPSALIDKQEYYDRPYILMSGVGNPDQVENSAQNIMGRPPTRHLVFADHYPYSATDVRTVAALSGAATPVLCTPKDAVKLQTFGKEWGETPVWAMETHVRFGPYLFCETPFPQWWEKWWRARSTAR
ncbi:MAG: tetraacyldisaccharide 4'-kinase [Desulfovibrio sp.]|nr:tetraacyldisaccharide 4'-kinase [Desulfovibrio sp.]